jgi:hypothetical protein
MMSALARTLQCHLPYPSLESYAILSTSNDGENMDDPNRKTFVLGEILESRLS